MRKTMWGFLVVLALFMAGGASAQVAWDSPMLLPPGSQPGFGLYLIDAHGGEIGVLGTWRSPSWNFGLRGGIAEDRRGRGSDADDGVAILAGIDFDGRLTRASDQFPLDIDWVFGAGLSVGDDVWIAVPIGLSIGHTFRGEGVDFTPYATPRVVLDAILGDDGRRDDDDDVSLDFAFDLGLDLRFGRNFTVRFGATLGDRDAVAIGVVF